MSGANKVLQYGGGFVVISLGNNEGERNGSPTTVVLTQRNT